MAAGAALGAGELVAGVLGARSPVAAVADWIVDLAPGGFLRFGVATFGESDKPALLVSVVVVALVAGALLGRVAAGRPWAGAGILAAFGFIGMLAQERDQTVSSTYAFLIGGGGALAGYVALRVLLREAEEVRARVDEAALTPSVVTPGRGIAGRRRFLAFAGATAAGASLTAVVGRGVNAGVDVEAQRAALVLPTGGAATSNEGLAVAGVSPLVTPNKDFYRIDTAFVVPRVDSSRWRLRVTGMVANPFEITFDELLSMPSVEEWVTLTCVSNAVGGELVGNALWRGVPLATLFERAGVQPGATQVVGRSVDDFTVGFPTDVALDGRASMVAYAMNGEPLPAAHGFPARLIVPGLYGYVSATKWLNEIELTTLDAFDAYWIPRGWAKQAPIKTQSRIDTPSGKRTLAAGSVPIAGVAWGGVRSVSRVDVRITAAGSSEGSWHRARLGEALSSSTWRQWVVEDWSPGPGEYRLEVQATDGTGAPQTEQRHEPAPNGATGLHTVTVKVKAG